MGRYHRHLTIKTAFWVLSAIYVVFDLNCLTAQLSYEGRAAVEGAK
jgi:hypothetical protein